MNVGSVFEQFSLNKKDNPLKKRSLMAFVLFSILLFSCIYSSYLVPDVHATQVNLQEKALSITNDVIGLDLIKYTTNVKQYSPETYLDVLSSEQVRCTIHSDDSDLDVLYTFVDTKLQRIHVLDSEGSPHMTKSAITTFDLAKNFLENYHNYTENSFYGNLRSTLNTVESNKNSTQIIGNTKLEIAITSDFTTFRWTYVFNGIEAPDKCVALRFKNGVLKYFIDNWNIYNVGSTKINYSEKDAIDIALERTRNTSIKLETENGTIDLKFNVTNAMIWETIFAPSTYVDISRGENKLELYPMYHVWVSLDKFYPGNIYGYNVYVWADNGKVCYIKERVTTMDPPADLVATFDDATKIFSVETEETEVQSNSIPFNEILLSIIVAVCLVSAPLYFNKKEKITLHFKVSKSWSCKATGLMFCFMLTFSTLIIAVPVSVVNADDSPQSKAMVWGSESSGSYNQTHDFNWRKSPAEVKQQQETAQIITDLFASNGYNATNSQGLNGTTSYASAILEEIEYNELNFERVAVVDFDHGNGQPIPWLNNEFHYMFEDQNGTMVGEFWPGTGPIYENGVFDMDISQKTILGNNTFFTLISACNSAHFNETYYGAYDSEQGIIPGTDRARGMPYAWTHRIVDNLTPGNQIDTNYNMSDDGYADPDNGEFCYMGFFKGSAALNQTINATGPSYHEWLELFFNKTLTENFTIIQALNEASLPLFDGNFGDTPLCKNFIAMWPMYIDGNWTTEYGDPNFVNNGTLKVYGNGKLVLYRPKLTVLGAYGGTTDPVAGEYRYVHGSTVSVTANSTVDGGYFVHWLLDGNHAGNYNPINITMTEDHTLEPVFYAPPVDYTLSFCTNEGVTADVYLDGQYKGAFSAHTFYVLPGPHTLEVSIPNGVSFQNFSDSNGQTHYTNPATIYVWGDNSWVYANYIRTLQQPTIVSGFSGVYSDGTSSSLQRKTFYFNNRFWAFYSDYLCLLYRSSVDGTTWSSATSVGSTTYGSDFSICFDAPYLHVVWKTPGGYLSTPNPTLYYRRGIPNVDGTITWNSSQVVAPSVYPVTYFDPTIAVDSDGYPWVSYNRIQWAYNDAPYVVKSSTKDGTWSTADGFPYQLRSNTPNGFSVSLVSLTSGKMLALYGTSQSYIFAKRWDGSSWSGQIATAASNYCAMRLSAVTHGGDDVQIVCRTTSNLLLHLNYSYSANSFSSPITVQTNVGDGFPVLATTDSDDLYTFWPESGHVYYKKFSNATRTWDANSTDWIYDMYFTNNLWTLTCSYQNYLGKISILYQSSSIDASYKIKFDYLSVPITTYSLYNLSIADVTGGSTYPSAGTYTYMPDVDVQVTAAPNPGFMLDYWLLDDINIGNNLTITVTMNSSHSLEPVFTAYGIGRVQGNARGTATGATNSISVTLDYVPTDGNVLVATVGAWALTYGSNSVTGITQAGVTWTRQATGSYTNIASEIWLGVVGPDASKTLTVTLENPVGANVLGIADVCEYTGIATTNYLDQNASQHGYPDEYGEWRLYTGITSTTTQANELWIGCIFTLSNHDQYSPSNGFTLLDGMRYSQSLSCLGYLEKFVTSTGAASTSTLCASDPYFGCIATFKAAP